MATVQQSIEIRVPLHTAYNQLTRFEDYPCFMDEVETVQQTDDTHLHWTTVMSNRPVEWDAEITEQEADRCIAWRNVDGPTNAGKVELQPVGPDTSRVVFTLESRPEQVPGSLAGYSEEDMARRLKLDLARLKDFIEARGTETGADPQEGRGSPRNSPVPTSSYAAGSEGFAGTEEPTAPVTSSARTAAEQRNDSAGSTRHVGQMPQDTSAERHNGTPTSDAMGKAMPPERQDDAGRKPATDSAALQSQPERGRQPGAGRAADGGTGVGGTAAAVGAAGGTDAAAGARMAGSPPAKDSTGEPGGSTATAGGGSAAAGAAAAGGTGLGGADMGADAGAARAVPREGTTGAAGGSGGSAGTGGSAKP